MTTPIRRRLLRTAFLSAIALIIGIGVGFYQIYQEEAHVVNKGSQPLDVAGVDIGGPFELIAHTGETVTQARYDGRYKLLYFGFTYCPAICPTELQKITKVLNKIGPAGDDIQPLFITIDPERDTPAVMKDYVGLFHPRLIGLTGSPEQIDPVLKQYRVFARKVEDETMSDYTMDHSSFIYFLSPDNKLISLYRIQDDADFILRDIQSRLGKV